MSNVNNNSNNNYLGIIEKARKAVPFLKYALGIAAIFAVIGLITLWGLNFRSAILGAVVILVLMVVLFALSRLSQLKDKTKLPAIVLLWSIILIFIACISLLFTSIFFQYPLSLGKWIDPGYQKNKSLPVDSSSLKTSIHSESKDAKPDSPIFKKAIKEVSIQEKPFIETNKSIRDTVINAPNALIVTQNQSGGNNTVTVNKSPKAYFDLHLDVNPNNMPVTEITFLKRLIPREEYIQEFDQDTAYYSKYVFDYSSEAMQSNFSVQASRSDVIYMNLACAGCSINMSMGVFDLNRPGILISSPQNSRYILHIYTKRKIDKFFDGLHLSYNVIIKHQTYHGL